MISKLKRTSFYLYLFILFEIETFNNIINVFTVIFDRFNVILAVYNN